MKNIMTVRAQDGLREALSRRAKELGITRNALILQILWDWADRNLNNQEETRNETDN